MYQTNAWWVLPMLLTTGSAHYWRSPFVPDFLHSQNLNTRFSLKPIKFDIHDYPHIAVAIPLSCHVSFFHCLQTLIIDHSSMGTGHMHNSRCYLPWELLSIRWCLVQIHAACRKSGRCCKQAWRESLPSTSNQYCITVVNQKKLKPGWHNKNKNNSKKQEGLVAGMSVQQNYTDLGQ